MSTRIELFAAGAAAILAGCSGASDQGNLSSGGEFDGTPIGKQQFDLELRQACGAGQVTPQGEDALGRKPYLQKTTSTSTELLWTTTESDPSQVRVSLPDGTLVDELVPEVDPSASQRSFTQYVARIEGLEPNQIYCYQVLGADETWQELTGFRTAPDAAADDTIRIVALGDLGQQTPDQFAVRDAMARVPFDFALVAGDLAYETGTLSDHENNFFDVYEGLLRSVPFFVISGNHDYASDGAVFREVFALPEDGVPEANRERWYSFDWGSVHVVALDTEQMNSAQAAWLDADLTSNQQPWTIVLMHKPPFSSGYHGSTIVAQDLFVPVFERHQVDLVLAGHDHNYERTSAIGDVVYVVTGSGGRGTRAVGVSDFTVYSEAVAHFSYITVTPDEMRLTAVDAVGGEFDQVSILAR